MLSGIAVALQVQFVNLEQLGLVGGQEPEGATRADLRSQNSAEELLLIEAPLGEAFLPVRGAAGLPVSVWPWRWQSWGRNASFCHC